ncbi:MAG: S41 family peptidase, partial [Bacteroidota bacterium]
MTKIYIPLFLLLSLCCHAQQQDATVFKQKAKTLRIFLDKNHYAPLQWNDSASLLLYNRWMKILDDDKMYFTKADIDILETYKTKLDDEMNGGEWAFFDKSLQLYKKAVRQSDSLKRSILSKPADFSKPDALHYPFANFAPSYQELQQRFTKLIKWRILYSMVVQLDSANSANANTFKMPADFAAKEIKAREKLKKQHEINMKVLPVNNTGFVNEMEEKYLQAISWCYDPHTQYMSLEEKKGFETELSGFEYSTGMGLEQNDDGNYEVDRLEPGGNAWRSGDLHKGDVVLSIKKGKGPDKLLSEMDEDEVDELLQGNSDEKVELTVKTAAGLTKKVTLTKEKVTNDEGIVKSYVINGKQKIGYIKLPDFYSRESEEINTKDDITYDGCANDVSKEIVKLKKDTIAALILDLRYNGGGSMWEAMQLAGIFIDYGPVGSVKDKEGKVRFLKDPNRGTAYDGPLLVMVNGASASASELTSAMLQDYKRALIIGSTTYGKGTSQRVLPLDTAFFEDSKKDYKSYTEFVKVT